MSIYKANHKNILLAADEIKHGGLVGFPTETVYGLGADGMNSTAVAKIFETKNRPTFNPLILHINSVEQLDSIAKINNAKTNILINNFWPGPLTLVLKKKECIPDIVTAGNDTVAVRMPANKTALELIYLAETPIAAPSANVFGKLSPTTAFHVEEQLGDKVDVILDGGKCKVGVESTILKISENEVILLRPGGLSVEKIETALNEKIIRKNISEEIISPGLLKSHYAPEIPIRFIDDINLDDYRNQNVGVLLFDRNSYNFDFKEIKYLSKNGQLREAAANLFVYLHEFENANLDLIVCEKINPVGLGSAIMDRLEKAVNKYS